jgi:hypothetical protein
MRTYVGADGRSRTCVCGYVRSARWRCYRIVSSGRSIAHALGLLQLFAPTTLQLTSPYSGYLVAALCTLTSHGAVPCSLFSRALTRVSFIGTFAENVGPHECGLLRATVLVTKQLAFAQNPQPLAC